MSDNEDGEYWFNLSGVSDLTVGRGVHFCCLSCGIPLAFPDDAYLSNKKDIVEMLRFSHCIRREMRMWDRSSASTLQWHMNKSHYVHVFLHKSLLKSCIGGSVAGPKRWDHQRQFLAACHKLISAVRLVPGPLNNGIPLHMTERFLDVTSPWCNACNIAATNNENLRALMGIQEAGQRTARLPGVPDVQMVPMGMRIMHDTYLFMYTIAACISTMLTANCSNLQSPTQNFRLDCLVRLYTGYLIYALAKNLNKVLHFVLLSCHAGMTHAQEQGGSLFGDLSFEHWYMFFFNNLQLWERCQLKVLFICIMLYFPSSHHAESRKARSSDSLIPTF